MAEEVEEAMQTETEQDPTTLGGTPVADPIEIEKQEIAKRLEDANRGIEKEDARYLVRLDHTVCTCCSELNLTQISYLNHQFKQTFLCLPGLIVFNLFLYNCQAVRNISLSKDQLFAPGIPGVSKAMYTDGKLIATLNGSATPSHHLLTTGSIVVYHKAGREITGTVLWLEMMEKLTRSEQNDSEIFIEW